MGGMLFTGRRRNLYVSGFLAFLCVFCRVSAAPADSTLVLSGFEAPGLTPVAQDYLEKAYADLGLHFEVVLTEPSRALVNSTSGVTDGEVVRIGLDNVYPIPSSRKVYSFFHYLHERHQGLVPLVEKALRNVLGQDDKPAGEGPS